MSPEWELGSGWAWGSTHPVKQLLWSEDFPIFIKPVKITRETQLAPVTLGTHRPFLLHTPTALILLLSPEVPPQPWESQIQTQRKTQEPLPAPGQHRHSSLLTPHPQEDGTDHEPCQGAEQHQFDEQRGAGHRPVSLAEHEARVHGVEVPFHFPACSLEEQRDTQHTCPTTCHLSPLAHCPMKGTSHLFNEQPRVAGPPKQRWLLQSMFKYGLQGWTECPSHQVCHPLCDRVISSNGILRKRKNQLSGGRAWRWSTHLHLCTGQFHFQVPTRTPSPHPPVMLLHKALCSVLVWGIS